MISLCVFKRVLEIGGARVVGQNDIEKSPTKIDILFFEPNCKQLVTKYESNVHQVHQIDSIADIILNQVFDLRKI